MSEGFPARVERLVVEARRAEVFSAAQLVAIGPHRYQRMAIGQASFDALPSEAAVDHETPFDVASLTKALVTSTLLMQACDEGRLTLDEPLARYFPAVPQAHAITIEHLATHQSGLPAHRPYFEQLAAQSISSGEAARAAFLDRVRAESPASAPGVRTEYSDLGFVLLGWVLEQVLEAGLDALFAERIAAPLGLIRTGYGPVDRPVVATRPRWGGGPPDGVVHDDNARALGGVEGHAGLFATATEVCVVVRHLAEVHGGGAGIIRSDTVQRFWRAPAGRRFAGGWDTPTEPSSSGRYTTRGQSVGHLGFTGCSVWHDIAREVTIVLLTNRVHAGPDSSAIRTLRPRLHDEVNRVTFTAD